jgi:hypothetical protein
MYVYHAGFFSIYLLFFLMHRHAKSKATEIELNEAELFETNSFIYINFIMMCIGVAGAILTLTLPIELASVSGMIYMIIPLAYWLLFAVRGRISLKRFGKINELTG